MNSTTSLLPQYPVTDTVPAPPPNEALATPPRRALVVADGAAATLALARPLVGAGYETIPATVADMVDALARAEAEVVVVDADGSAPREAGFWQALQTSPHVVRVLVTHDSDLAAVTARVRPASYDAIVHMDAVEATLGETVTAAAAARVEDAEQVSPAEARRLALAMVRTLALRGFESESHCQRLAVWARALGKKLGLSAARLLDVELGALLHDVGQLATPDAVLANTGRLSPEQWKELRRHPDLGAELLRGFPALRRAIPVVQCHHERRDGAGYPRGLSGTAIPLDARIFQLVDAYDALTTSRPHRPARTDAAAREEILRSVGEQFDPEVYQAFASISPEEWQAMVGGVR